MVSLWMSDKGILVENIKDWGQHITWLLYNTRAFVKPRLLVLLVVFFMDVGVSAWHAVAAVG